MDGSRDQGSLEVLDDADLKLDDELLLERIREASLDALDDDDAPWPLKELGMVVELDDQVLNGGFSQYFFNPSFAGVLNGWLLTRTEHPALASLIEAALRRMQVEYGEDLDIAAHFEAKGAGGLSPILNALMCIRQQAHAREQGVYDQLGAFHARLAEERDGLPGFEHLDEVYLDTIDLDSWLIDRVRSDPASYR